MFWSSIFPVQVEYISALHSISRERSYDLRGLLHLAGLQRANSRGQGLAVFGLTLEFVSRYANRTK